MGWLVTLRCSGLGLVGVVGFSGVAYRGAGAVPQFGLFGAGAQGGGDVGPAGAVLAGVRREFGDHAFGLVDEAGEQGDRGERVAGPPAAAAGELAEAFSTRSQVSLPLC